MSKGGEQQQLHLRRGRWKILLGQPWITVDDDWRQVILENVLAYCGAPSRSWSTTTSMAGSRMHSSVMGANQSVMSPTLAGSMDISYIVPCQFGDPQQQGFFVVAEHICIVLRRLDLCDDAETGSEGNGGSGGPDADKKAAQSAEDEAKAMMAVDTELTFQMEALANIFEATSDKCVLYFDVDDNSLGMSVPQRRIIFSKEDDRERLLAQVSKAMSESDACFRLLTTDKILKSGDDIARVLSEQERKDKLELANRVKLMDGSSDDYAKVAPKEAVNKRLADEGNTKLHFSCEAHLIRRDGGQVDRPFFALLTNRAVYIIKNKPPLYKTVYAVEYNAIDELRLENDNPNILLIKLDFNVTIIRSDILLHLDDRMRNYFVRHLTHLFEATTIRRLPIQNGTFIWLGKRGYIEANLVRALRYMRTTTGQQASEVVLREEEREACQWLLWLITQRLYNLITVLSSSNLKGDELNFISRRLVSACEQSETVGDLLRYALWFEMEHAAQAHTILRGNTLPTLIVVNYVAHSGDEFTRLALSPVVENFLSEGESNDKLGSSRLEHWCTQFLLCITRQSSILPYEMKHVIAYLADAAASKALDPLAFIGGFVFLRFLSPAILSPHTHGLVHSNPTDEQLKNLEHIGRLLQSLANQRAPGGALSEGAEKLIRAHSQTMRQYLNSLVQQDLVKPKKERKGATVIDFTRTTEQVHNIVLDGHNTKLLLALHETLGAHVGRFFCNLWATIHDGQQKLNDVAQKAQRVNEGSERIDKLTMRIKLLEKELVAARASQAEELQTLKFEVEQTNREMERVQTEASYLQEENKRLATELRAVKRRSGPGRGGQGQASSAAGHSDPMDGDHDSSGLAVPPEEHLRGSLLTAGSSNHVAFREQILLSPGSATPWAKGGSSVTSRVGATSTAGVFEDAVCAPFGCSLDVFDASLDNDA